MSRKINRSSWKLSVQLLLVLAAALLVWGCGGGGSSYDAPEATNSAPLAGQTQNVLIDAATLKGWIDEGLVNADGFEKVVILDTSSSGYAAGHVPGAQLWATSGINRYDGPVLSGNMVLDGASMDSALQALGIDENTTVVFASNSNPARIYFMFRYWGFPKARLKILNGNIAAWNDAGYDLSTEVPDVEPSTFSVSNLPSFNPEVRAALSEFINGVNNDTVQPLNALTNNTEKAGATTGIFAPSGDYVIFQGSIQGAAHVGNAAFYDSGYVRSADEIQDLLESYGIDGTKPIITYCRAGNAASNAFMPIDVTVGWDVMVYDGSWSQWGSLTNETDAAYVPDETYTLPALLSGWATDGLIEWHTLNNDDYAIPANQIAGPYYNVNFPRTIEKPFFRILDNALSPTDSGANSIEIEDEDYYFDNASSGGSAPDAGSSDPSGC